MKNKLKSRIINFISYLYIFLFTYTAISKIIDFETFLVQLGQSPLLSAYANWVAVFCIYKLNIKIYLLKNRK